MISNIQKPAAEHPPRPQLAMVLVAGVLALGGGIGFAFNRTTPHRADIRSASASDVDGQDAASLGAESVAAQGEPTVASFPAGPAALRLAEVIPPDNPFLPTAATAEPRPAAAPALPQALPGAAGARVKIAPARTAPVAARKPAPAVAPAPSPDELVLSGIVHGEPPLAVVKFSGQSLFLKTGDQVADTWRLTEIKERSAVFQLGERRIEIQIQGGSSQ